MGSSSRSAPRRLALASGGSLAPRLVPHWLALAATALALFPAAASAGVLEKPIDPRQQTALAFGERSHWLQPWRAYLDTPRASALRRAIGINFNVSPEEAPATAELLGRSGFARARVEISWDQMDYRDPARLRDPGRLRGYLAPLKANGIRPLILLNANHGLPGPARLFDAVLARPARRGQRHVQLAPASARQVVPGRSGLNSADPWRAADVIFTSVGAAGWARLSRPLPRALPAGRHSAVTLRYAPFGPPRLPGGRPNPAFEETLGGWLAYVGAVTREAREVLGGTGFDVEVWNELSFGSDFLFQERYYDPPRERGQGDVTRAILGRTVAYLRDPRNGLAGVGIADGFASQTPFAAASSSPPGLTALSKHPYKRLQRFPADASFDTIAPLDAHGRTSFAESSASGAGPMRRDRFVPRYRAFFPEYFLSGIQTEHVVRDLSPIASDVYGTRHGRGRRRPAVWITEANFDRADVPGLTGAQAERLQAKAALRYYTAFASKGARAVHLYAAKDDNLSLIQPSFFTAVHRDGGAYPGAAPAGATPRAVGRLVDSLAGSAPLRRTRPLSLLRISDRHDRRQFSGDGSAAHPPLFDRDVLAFFPFQLRRGSYVAAVYVMTRDLARPYRRRAGRLAHDRYDLPPRRFRLVIGGLRHSRVRASATDPLTGRRVQVRARPLGRGRVAVVIPATDSPRMLRITERGRARSPNTSRARHDTSACAFSSLNDRGLVDQRHCAVWRFPPA